MARLILKFLLIFKSPETTFKGVESSQKVMQHGPWGKTDNLQKSGQLLLTR